MPELTDGQTATTPAQSEPAVPETAAPETGQEPGQEAASVPESFGEMSGEEQEQALIDMGLVEDETPETQPEESRDPQRQETETSEPREAERAETPAFYTPDELGNTPLDQIDTARLPEGARDYLPIVRRNMEAARQTIDALQRQNAELMRQIQQGQTPQAQAQGQGQTQTASDGYKALAAEAVRLAKERLGLGDDDDLEIGYEPEHAAAYFRAMQEVTAGQAAETARREQAALKEREGQEFNAYTGQLQARPDFKAFDEWVTGRLAKSGKSPEMLAEYLRATGDYAGTRRTLEAWFRMYQEDTARRAQQPPRGRRAPVLESAGGGATGTTRGIDFKKFGAMDNDAQEQAILEMGIL